MKVKEQQQNENNFKHKQQQQAKLTDTTDVRQKLHISASRTHIYTVCLSITVSAVACLALVPSLGCACVVGWRKLMHCCLHIHTPPYIHKYIYKRNIYIFISAHLLFLWRWRGFFTFFYFFSHCTFAFRIYSPGFAALIHTHTHSHITYNANIYIFIVYIKIHI